MQSATQVSPQNIHESFLVNHNLVWNQIQRNSFAEGNPEPAESRVDYCPQDEKQRVTLRSRYPPECLYVTKENIASTSSLDLSANRGTLVAVIKKQDPAGDLNRWFVDNGSLQGFMPARGLKRQSPTQESSRSSVDVVDSLSDLMSFDSPKKIVPRSSSLDSRTNWYENISCGSAESVASSNLDLSSLPQRYENVKPQVCRFFLLPFTSNLIEIFSTFFRIIISVFLRRVGFPTR